MVLSFLVESSLMMNLSIIIGSEEVESCSLFDVLVSYFPVHPHYFLR